MSPPRIHIYVHHHLIVLNLSQFRVQSEVYNIIMGMAKKLCALDPIPTPLLVKSIDALLSVITEIINLSLQSGYFPPVWKEALVLPILKKANLDLVYKNYRPVSNLSFISKVIERAMFLQLDNYMKRNDLYPSLQSAYRRNHSTETALLKVTNDIRLNMNSQRANCPSCVTRLECRFRHG